MVGVNIEDRNALRFLWCNDKNVDDVLHFRFKRLPFGLTCSPALLNIVLSNLLETSESLIRDFYVDHLISGLNDLAEVNNFLCLRDVLKSNGFVLRDWISSNIDICRSLGVERIAHSHVLGIPWDVEFDKLGFKLPKSLNINSGHTKRNVLSVLSQIYDPLGVLAPIVITGKLIFQDLWRLKLSWDDDIPNYASKNFQNGVKFCMTQNISP